MMESDEIKSSGKLVFNDINDNDIINISTGILETPQWNGGELDPELISKLQSGLNISGFEEDANNILNWIFEVSDLDLNFLADNDIISFAYFVEVSDGSGEIATDTLRITISGTNDSPSITTESTTIII